MTSYLAQWASGQPCQVHELIGCAYCRDAAGIVRHNGVLRYDGDCALQTYQEITGADYEEAVDALSAAGYRPGVGTPKTGLAVAFAAVGFAVTPSALDLAGAKQASTAGRYFFVSATKGKGKSAKGHVWAVIDGKATRPYRPPFRYQIFEVTA